MWQSKRVAELPPYLFVEIDRRKRAARQAGRDVIDMGVGDPDMPTMPFVVEAMARSICDAGNHRYSAGIGTAAFREAAADYMLRRFGVRLDPASEIIALLGTKEGLGHLPLAVLNPGEVALIPDPGYPVYESSCLFAGGKCHKMALGADNGWLPLLEQIPRDVRRAARLMVVNYPNNPTAACASLAFMEQVVGFAREHHILIASDAAYADLYFEQPPSSMLQIDGARQVCVEFHSLSKTFNMTGWRIGFAAGNAEAIASLAAIKSNVDSGPFGAIQDAGIVALAGSASPPVVAQRDMYRQRRDALVSGLRRIGWQVEKPAATFFVWAQCPSRRDSMATALDLLERADVVAIPGCGFGACGEGFIRFALTMDQSRIDEAISRMAKL